MNEIHINTTTASAGQIDVVNSLIYENQLLRDRNSQLTQLNNNLMIEISQLKLEVDMMELKKGWTFDDRWENWTIYLATSPWPSIEPMWDIFFFIDERKRGTVDCGSYFL